MGPQSAPKSLSRRAFAAARGISEKAVRKRIAAGDLAEALLPDGTIDPEIADRLLAERTTAGKRVPAPLSAARLRKVRAHVATLQDRVAELRESVLTREEAATNAITARFIADRLARIPADAAPQVVGRSAGLIAELVREIVYAALDDLANTKITTTLGEDEKPPLVVSAMNAVALAAAKETLLAERLELRRALKRGELLDGEAYFGAFMQRISGLRTTMLGLPSKLAPHLAAAKDAEDARAMLKAEVDHAVEHLACEWITTEELIGGTAE